MCRGEHYYEINTRTEEKIVWKIVMMLWMTLLEKS